MDIELDSQQRNWNWNQNKDLLKKMFMNDKGSRTGVN
jgi:hypothetical protein